MADIDVPSQEEPQVQTITDGYFEEELHIDAQSAGDFLIALGKQLKEGDEITINGDGWRIPFTFAGPVELEIEYEGGDKPELEIEIELDGVRNDKAPSLG